MGKYQERTYKLVINVYNIDKYDEKSEKKDK